MKEEFIGLQEAVERTFRLLPKPLEIATSVLHCTGLVTSRDVHAQVDSPSTDVSMKDGYAIRVSDVRYATGKTPVTLDLCGVLGAGEANDVTVLPGTTVRILTGAGIPTGADAVIAEEFVTISGGRIHISEPETVGRNILLKGNDIARGDLIVAAGTFLTPGKIGLLAAGGIADLQVISRPRVALIASGDEIMLPGSMPCVGKIYASNLLTLNSWCRRYELNTEVFHVLDDEKHLKDSIELASEGNDVIVTSGGAWTSDRDLMIRALDDLGWKKSYHRVRLGPGKAVGFGLLLGKPVFILPGGPPSNLVAFIQVVLPALRKLCGYREPFLPQIQAQLGQTVEGQADWTQAIFGCLEWKDGQSMFFPQEDISRLKNIAAAEAILLIPEGARGYLDGTKVNVQLLE